MKICRLILPTKAVDAYLYGGYLFLFLQDGGMQFVRFNDLLYIAANGSKKMKTALQLTFLPHQYLRGNGYNFLLEFPEIKDAIFKQQTEYMNGWVFNLGEYDFEELITSFGNLTELPLDVSIYAGKMFLASDEGVEQWDLKPDYKYNIFPNYTKKLIDAESIALTAKAGMLAVSAKDDGLFSYNMFNGNEDCIGDRPAVEERSERAQWSPSFSIINYKNKVEFSLLENSVEKQDPESRRDFDLPHNYRKDIERKVITEIGVKKVGMTDVMEKTNLDSSQIKYIFNSQSAAFIFLKDGSLQIRNIIHNGNNLYFSSKLKHGNDDLTNIISSFPLSATAIQSGCIVETYDSILCVKEGNVNVIAQEPCYGIRSYLSSNNYRNLATAVFEDRVEIWAFPHLLEPVSRSRFLVKTASEIDSLIPDILHSSENKFPLRDPSNSTPIDADLPF